MLPRAGMTRRCGVCWCQWTHARSSSTRHWCCSLFPAHLYLSHHLYRTWSSCVPSHPRPASVGSGIRPRRASVLAALLQPTMTSAGLDAAPIARVEWHWCLCPCLCIGLYLLYLLFVLEFIDISVLLILPMLVLNVLFAIIASA